MNLDRDAGFRGRVKQRLRFVDVRDGAPWADQGPGAAPATQNVALDDADLFHDGAIVPVTIRAPLQEDTAVRPHHARSG